MLLKVALAQWQTKSYAPSAYSTMSWPTLKLSKRPHAQWAVVAAKTLSPLDATQMRHENRNSICINGLLRILIPPCGGSNPPAPTPPRDQPGFFRQSANVRF